MRFIPAVTAALLLTIFTCPAMVFAQDADEADQGVMARFDPGDFVSLETWPGDKLAGIPVETASGTRIGVVRMATLDQDGSAVRVLVGLHRGGYVWIVADALRYNPNDHILLTNLKHFGPPAHRESVEIVETP